MAMKTKKGRIVESDDLEFKVDDEETKCESEDDTEEVKTESDDSDEDDVKTESEDDEEVKTEEDDEAPIEVKTEEEVEDDVKAEEDEEEVKTEEDDEDSHTEPDSDNAGGPSDGDADNEVKTEEDDEAPSDDYKLSEELNDLLKVELDPAIKEKIDTAFDTIVKEQISRLKEQLRGDAEQQLKESVKKLSESVKVYVEKAARAYLKENKLALKESLRLKYFESFFGKVKTLFKENYVDLKESDEDALADLKKENDELKSKTDELVKDNTKLAESIISLKRQSQINEMASSMYLTESNRFKIASEKLLKESVKMSDKKFAEKLKTIAEMFSTKKSVPAKKKLLSEGKIQLNNAKTSKTHVHPDVAAILDGF